MGVGSAQARAAAVAPMHSLVNWALLGLVIERPSYAYELARRFERTYDQALALSSVSHVYTALATLRERELIEEMPGTLASVRSRRAYRATERGVAEHAEWVVGQVLEERRRQRVLIVQLGALAKAPERAIAALDAYEQACLGEMVAAPPAGSDEGPGTTRLVARLISEETRLTVAAKLRWVQYARAQVQAQSPPRPGSA
ncbi:MAG TPA: helix-turn-helix transcriptional regulator [Solirubrobacteraceae bacterium]|nr:helix-turn-helix transcriptional regulator [Solirubrobacteraceae bacterium]